MIQSRLLKGKITPHPQIRVFPQLTDSESWGRRPQVLNIQIISTLEPGQKPMCDLLGPPTDNYKHFTQQVSQREITLLSQDLVHNQCIVVTGGSSTQGLSPSLSRLAMLLHTVCLPRIVTSISTPLYQGPWEADFPGHLCQGVKGVVEGNLEDTLLSSLYKKSIQLLSIPGLFPSSFSLPSWGSLSNEETPHLC